MHDGMPQAILIIGAAIVVIGVAAVVGIVLAVQWVLS